MKKLFVGYLIVFLLAPSVLLAESTHTPQEQYLLNQISILQKQVNKLLQMIAELPSQDMLASLSVYPSRFYDGDYEALYWTDDGELKRRDGKLIREGDQFLWQAYTEMVGQDFVDTYISEFRVFNDEEYLLTGYVDQKTDGSWILAINQFGDDFTETYLDDFVVELLLHETGHIIFFADDKYGEEFIDRFWENATMNRYEDKLAAASNLTKRTELAEEYYQYNQNDFVTDYAASSPTEDLVETFVEFVTHDYPKSNQLKDQKIKFFYQYPTLVNLRKDLRQSQMIKAQL